MIVIDNSIHSELLLKLNALIVEFQKAKPLDRSEAARRYQVTITDLQKIRGYFNTDVVIANINGNLDGN